MGSYTPLWKRAIPPAAPDLIARPELLRRLDVAVRRPVTHVCAAPGFGKTTQLAMWARGRAESVAWYSLDGRDRDPAMFATGLLAAFGERLPVDAGSALPAQRGPDAASDRTADATAEAIAETVERALTGPLVLVVDGCEEVAGRAAAMLTALTRQLPSLLALVLAGRSPAPVPLAELRGRGLLSEVAAGDLAFSTGHTGEVLATALGPDGRSLAGTVQRYTGGWPAAVRLLAETLGRVPQRNRADHLRAMAPATISQDTVDYLAGEVMSSGAERIRPLWWVAGGQPRFTAAGCRAAGLDITEADLRDLANRGLLTLVEDVPDRAYAVPPILAAAARGAGVTTTDDDRRRAFAFAAARSLRQRGRPAEALRAILVLDDPAALTDHLAEHGPALLAAGEAAAVSAAVGSIPAASLPPAVHMVAGRARHIQGDWESALAHFQAVDPGGGPLPAGLAWRLAVIHYDRGDLDAALGAIARGTRDDGADWALLLSWTAAIHWLRHDARRCRETAAAALDAAQACGDGSALATAHTTCGMVAAMDGDQNGNAWHYEQAIRAATAAGDVLALIRVRNNNGSRLLEAGQFRAAVREFDETIRLAELTGSPSVLALATANRGQATFALGRLDEAVTDFGAALAIYRRLGSRMVAYALLGSADLYRVRGNLELARATYEEAVVHSRAGGDRQGSVPALAGLARSIVDDDPDRADALVAEALDVDKGIAEAEVTLAAGWIALVRGDAHAATGWAGRALSAAGTRRQGPRLAEAIELAALAGPSADRVARLAEAADLWRGMEHAPGAAVNEYLRARLTGGPAGAAEHRLQLMAVRVTGSRHAAGPLRWLAAEHAPPSVRLRTLGGFELLRDAVPVAVEEWRSRKARDLLTILVANRGRMVPRDSVAEALWPGEPPERLPNRLSVALSTLRAVLDPARRFEPDHYVVADRARLRLGTLDVDVLSFLRTAGEGMRLLADDQPVRARAALVTAEVAYTGDFLSDDPYAPWTAGLRDEARATYLRVVRTLADLAAADDDTDTAVQYLLRLLGHDPHDEPAHLRLVSVLRAGGRHGEARRAYRRYTERMVDIDVEPAPFPLDRYRVAGS
jgi:ATP/maltotriose-dependent transcriptional regulator MalT/DNA-binding SARP family transcriptional activator